MHNKRNSAKYTKPTRSSLELGAQHWHPTSSCQAALGNPRLASAAGRNWTQGWTEQGLDQERRQNNKQGPLQQEAMDK